MATERNGDFLENRRLILFRLDRLDEEVAEIKEAVHRIEVELVGLKIRAGMWGAIAGALPTLVATLVYIWKGP